MTYTATPAQALNLALPLAPIIKTQLAPAPIQQNIPQALLRPRKSAIQPATSALISVKLRLGLLEKDTLRALLEQASNCRAQPPLIAIKTPPAPQAINPQPAQQKLVSRPPRAQTKLLPPQI